MKKGRLVFATFILLFGGFTVARPEEALKIGLITTLSGPGAVLGQQQRNGYQLGLKNLGGKLGGRAVELIVQDDELKPDVAVSKVRAFIDRDKVDFVVGPIFSNILNAIAKPATEGGAFLISSNAGPSSLAGASCNQNLFVTSYQNDQIHAVLGKYAEDKGFKKLLLIAPNYQAGRDAIEGFKRYYTGQIADELYVPLNQLDYSAELSTIASTKPDAIFTFLPGGFGINFVKQFRQAGLGDKLTFLSAFTVDESTLPAQGEAALGILGGANWAPNLDNNLNKQFVADYEREFNAIPNTTGAQSYDAAFLIDAALKHTGGATQDKDALRNALKNSGFTSVRGDFKFNNNHFPIQNFYLVKAAKRADGKPETQIVEKVFSEYGDLYASQCAMK
jgi:branched-chain amino acid transport system substrate-binding protein